MTFDKQKLPAHSKDHSPAGISHRNSTKRHGKCCIEIY